MSKKFWNLLFHSPESGKFLINFSLNKNEFEVFSVFQSITIKPVDGNSTILCSDWQYDTHTLIPMP